MVVITVTIQCFNTMEICFTKFSMLDPDIVSSI